MFKLTNTKMEDIKIKKTDTILDAYCGTGTIGILASNYASEVIGVELNPDAVKDARLNAKRNQIKNFRKLMALRL